MPLVALPPGDVMTILPVLAPVGTVIVTCLSELTVNDVTFTPPRVTVAAWMSPEPLTTTEDPTDPLGD